MYPGVSHSASLVQPPQGQRSLQAFFTGPIPFLSDTGWAGLGKVLRARLLCEIPAPKHAGSAEPARPGPLSPQGTPPPHSSPACLEASKPSNSGQDSGSGKQPPSQPPLPPLMHKCCHILGAAAGPRHPRGFHDQPEYRAM